MQNSLLLGLLCKHPVVDLESGPHYHTCRVSKDMQ